MKYSHFRFFCFILFLLRDDPIVLRTYFACFSALNFSFLLIRHWARLIFDYKARLHFFIFISVTWSDFFWRKNLLPMQLLFIITLFVVSRRWQQYVLSIFIRNKPTRWLFKSIDLSKMCCSFETHSNKCFIWKEIKMVQEEKSALMFYGKSPANQIEREYSCV